jgi:amidase
MNWVGTAATRIADAVQRGDATATQVIADHIDHARLADRVVAALRMMREEEAIAEAEQVDELYGLGALPLAGVPVAVAENTPVAGLPVALPSRTPLAAQDDEVVRRLRGAGAVVLGVTRISELGLWAMTDDSAAITRNPWRSDLSAGGAAGGAAAAVAAGITPVAQATDGFGSLRIPAACCGVLGLKSGQGLIEYRSGDWLDTAEHGVMATTVEDLAASFAVLIGRHDAPAPESGRVRVAMSWRTPLPGVTADSDVREAVSAAARTLVAAGHDVIGADPPYLTRLAMMLSATWTAVAHLGAESLEQPQPRTQRHAAIGAQALRRQLAREGERLDWRERCVAWFADGGYDLLLLPTLPGPAPAARYWSERSWRVNTAASLRLSAFTAPWNLAGLPALTVPWGVRRDGMPGSVQLVAPPGAEATLLATAALFEERAPWRRHAPSWPRDPSHLLRERTAAYPFVAIDPSVALRTA